jgi:hypothetical protein
VPSIFVIAKLDWLALNAGLKTRSKSSVNTPWL